MSFIRKALWPASIALGLLVFLGAFGAGTSSVSAAGPGDICGVSVADILVLDDDEDVPGLPLVAEETAFAVWAIIEFDAEDTEYTAEINGNADVNIIGVLDGNTADDLENVGPTQEVNDLESQNPEDFTTGLNFELDDLGFTTETGTDDCVEPHEIVLIIVDCEEEGGGTFDVTFADESEDDDSLALEIDCRGPSDDATLDVIPNKIEIIPAIGNVSHSLVRLELVDANGNPAFPGEEVLFTVDRCAIEESGVDTEDEFEEAEELFEDFSPNLPYIAEAIEDLAADDDVDGTEEEDNTVSFSVDDDGDDERTVAAAIVHCDPAAAPGATPGVITVTAIVEQDGADDIYTAKITVVGPPASITVTASPTELRCGEKASIVVVVKDSIGQNVSDHTQVEAVTNAGGVLGGTGAVIGQAGPVVPISSTVSETFNGTTTFFLLTSEQHSGPYEVVVTTGGNNVTAYGNLGGLFSTPAISAQTTVKCSIPVVAPAAPAPAPTITAPRTGDLGTGTIRPPSTGDAGLADASGTSWSLVALGAVVAFGLAGVATVKVTRR